VRAGPVDEPVELTAGDFVRFPGDTPHLLSCLSERASAFMVTTVPQVHQFGPTVAIQGLTEALPDGHDSQASG
jgi:quercetin dioxygenase-like cupin family protein